MSFTFPTVWLLSQMSPLFIVVKSETFRNIFLAQKQKKAAACTRKLFTAVIIIS
jgi:hypothetical protein